MLLVEDIIALHHFTKMERRLQKVNVRPKGEVSRLAHYEFHTDLEQEIGILVGKIRFKSKT